MKQILVFLIGLVLLISCNNSKISKEDYPTYFEIHYASRDSSQREVRITCDQNDRYSLELGEEGDVMIFTIHKLKNNKKKVLVFFPNGVLNRKYHMNNDLEEGEYIDFYTDGSVCTKGQYRKALKTGIWLGYSNDGELLYKARFRRGVEEKRMVDLDKIIIHD